MKLSGELLGNSKNLTTISFRLVLLVVIGIICYNYTFSINSFPYSKSFMKSVEGEKWQEMEIIHSEIQHTEHRHYNISGNATILKKDIVILRYTKYFGREESSVVLNAKKDCSYLGRISSAKHKINISHSLFNIPCRLTYERTFFNQSDAFVFHSHDLESENLPDGHRDPEKLWVYLQQESPQKTGLNLKSYRNIFNWTMTYRQDSDVYHPYAYIVSRETETSGHSAVKMSNKTGLVAWIVSNCEPPSKRQYFVYELQKYVPVDIFGFCGSNCPAHDCYRYVASKYKFYLSFENSLCKDYITEKFFKVLTFNMVPVVYGGSLEADYSEIAPEHSYIDARSFNSPKHLADYLIYLDNTEAEYLKYFEWKTKFEILYPHFHWCSLCQQVYEHVIENPRQIKWYKDLWKWWNFKGTSRVDGALGVTTSVCLAPLENFTNFYHGIFKVGIGGRVTNWARKNVLKK